MSRQGLTGERLIGLFVFGVLLFMPPLIGIFDRISLVRGVPLLYAYLFLAWTLLIALIALIVEREERPEDVAGGESEQGASGARRP